MLHVAQQQPTNLNLSSKKHIKQTTAKQWEITSYMHLARSESLYHLSFSRSHSFSFHHAFSFFLFSPRFCLPFCFAALWCHPISTSIHITLANYLVVTPSIWISLVMGMRPPGLERGGRDLEWGAEVTWENEGDRWGWERKGRPRMRVIGTMPGP